MRAAAQRGSWVKVAHVRTSYARSQFYFHFFAAVIQFTAVASLLRADVFRVRLGGHCTGIEWVQWSTPISEFIADIDR